MNLAKSKCPKCSSKDVVEGFQFTKGNPEVKWLICDYCGNEWNI